ncbi:transglycosylase domain-containing protein [Bradyrhizobium sp. CAR08]
MRPQVRIGASTLTLQCVCRIAARVRPAVALRISRLAERASGRLNQGEALTEDHRFYSRFGIDLAAIARSFHANWNLDGTHSTVSQQVARILFPSNGAAVEDRIHEALVAIWLERRLTKDELLTIYLNRVQIGATIFGVSDAARLYLNKRVQDMT